MSGKDLNRYINGAVMDLKRYNSMLKLLNKPFYAFFKGKDYEFKTLKEGEIFLSYADNFNDKFEGLITINEFEFKAQFLKLSIGEKLFDEIVRIFKWHKSVDLVSQINLATRPNCNGIPSYISDDLKNFILTFDTVDFERKVKNKFNAYRREISKVRSSFGIKCFTRVPPQHNSIMWAYYGNNYKGFNCGFSLEQVVYDLPSARGSDYDQFICEHIKPIKYKDNFDPNIEVNCEQLLKIPINKVNTSPYIVKLVEKSLLIKQSQWRHENEIRLIIRDTDNKVEIIDKCRKGFKIKFPYLDIVYICSRKNFFLREYNKDTKIHNEAKELAEYLRKKCVNLIPSKKNTEFKEEPNILEQNDIEEPIIYAINDVPF